MPFAFSRPGILLPRLGGSRSTGLGSAAPHTPLLVPAVCRAASAPSPKPALRGPNERLRLRLHSLRRVSFISPLFFPCFTGIRRLSLVPSGPGNRRGGSRALAVEPSTLPPVLRSGDADSWWGDGDGTPRAPVSCGVMSSRGVFVSRRVRVYQATEYRIPFGWGWGSGCVHPLASFLPRLHSSSLTLLSLSDTTASPAHNYHTPSHPKRTAYPQVRAAEGPEDLVAIRFCNSLA
ncbi:hypothetical protein C8R45DRAFT_1151766 [Mycena sanguinolenta]|nr:hypothetical protein C8R45DRAFT_1151766 [Mycena sanguinolenta]